MTVDREAFGANLDEALSDYADAEVTYRTANAARGQALREWMWRLDLRGGVPTNLPLDVLRVYAARAVCKYAEAKEARQRARDRLTGLLMQFDALNR